MKLINTIITSLLIITLIMVGGCTQKHEEAASPAEPAIELNVSAAASLQDAAAEIADLYQDSHPEVKITLNFASSGTLQKQIEEGAPADLFLSAGQSQMDALAEKDLIVSDTRQNFIKNDLVLIAGQDTALDSFEGLLNDAIENISIGTPETVPAGKYAKEALTSMGLYDQLQSQSKLVMAKDVRQVLTYVETGNAAAGMVYKSDTTGAEGIKIVAAAPEDSHKPIVYPLAVLKSSQNQAAAKEFADYIMSSEAGSIFTQYGFTLLK